MLLIYLPRQEGFWRLINLLFNEIIHPTQLLKISSLS